MRTIVFYNNFFVGITIDDYLKKILRIYLNFRGPREAVPVSENWYKF